MTGDAKTAALKIADQLGIADVRSDLKPEDKVEHLTNLKNEGRRVLMIGDGLNDAAALNTLTFQLRQPLRLIVRERPLISYCWVMT